MARKKPVKPVAQTDSYEEEEEDSSSTEMTEKVDVQQSPQIQPQNDDDSSSSDDETKKQPSSVIQKSEKFVSKPKKEKRTRPLEDKQNSVSSKKPKKEKEEGMSSKKKKKQATGLFQRVFSDKDEIKILKGLIDYKVEKGVDPMLDLDEFHGFIKNSLECECDKRQMADKIKRFKKRFGNDNKKLTNLHEREIFDLSKKIWEKQVQSVGDDEVNVNVKNNEVVVVNSSNGRGTSRSTRGVSSYLKWKGVDTVECDDGKDRLRKKGMELMGEKARAKLLEMWDEVDMAQMKVDGMRYRVLEEENRRIVEALSESGKP